MATFAQVALFGTDDLQSGLAESLITAGPGIGQIPVERVYGNAYTFVRKTARGAAGVVAADGTLSGATSPTVKQVTVSLSGVYGQEDIPNLLLKQGVGENQGSDTKAFYVQNAIEQVSNSFLANMITGTVALNGFDGIGTLLATTEFNDQEVDGTTGAFLDLVDEAKAKVLTPGVKVIMGNAAMERKFKTAYRALGGASITEVNGAMFESYDGAIFLRNDFITANDLYVLSFGGSGVSMVVPQGDIFSYTEFPSLEMKDATRVRVILYAAPVIRSVQSIAVVRNIA